MRREKEATEQRALMDERTLARAAPVPDLEKELFELGKPVGMRVLELCQYREKGSSSACNNAKREIKIVNMLHFVNNQIWKTLFGRPADGLEQSVDDDDEYRILDRQPITNKFVSLGMTKDHGGTNCAYYIAGIVEGALQSAGMDCKVSLVQAPAPPLS